MTFPPALPISLPTLSISLLPILLALCAYHIYRTTTPPPLFAPIYPTVLAVSTSPSHNFTKNPTSTITLIANLGVKDDAHLGSTVQHRSRLHISPAPANLRQVHLIDNETLEEFDVKPGEIGENITTVGIDLLALSKNSRLSFMPADSVPNAKVDGGAIPTITVRGLRNPCQQIEKHRAGLQEKFIVRDADRKIVERKAGIMCTVDVGGEVSTGMRIMVQKPVVFEKQECV